MLDGRATTSVGSRTNFSQNNHSDADSLGDATWSTHQHQTTQMLRVSNKFLVLDP